jgi:hypothetical protein
LERHFYVVDFENIGGLVMPIILEIEYFNGSKETRHYPAEIWRQYSDEVSKLLITREPIRALRIDPHLQTADINLANNVYPPEIQKARFKLSQEKLDKNPDAESGFG